MIIYVDVQTLALTTEGSVPLTDMALVRGDKIPLRIVLTDGPGQPADSTDAPVLAVKKSLGDDALVLAATGLERVEDALGVAYVGSLSVNTVQLADAMEGRDRIDLVGEVVLVAPDGAQRTSRLIRVTVRADLLAGDYAPPEDVLADWPALVAEALAAQLTEALQKAGMNVNPVTGSSVLSTGAAETPTTMACYAMDWGDELLAGQVPGHGRLRSLNMTYSGSSASGSYWLRIWRLVADAYVLAGVSAPEPLPGSNDPITWRFVPGVVLSRGDKIIMEVCAGPDADHLTTYAMGVHGVMTPAKDGRGRADQVSHPVVITQHDVAPRMTATVDYDDGVSVGGVEVATVTQVQALGTDVRTAAANSQAAAQSASGDASKVAADKQAVEDARAKLEQDIAAAQAILAAMPQVDDAGNMTLGGGLTASSGTINGTLKVLNTGTTAADINYIHGLTWMVNQVELRSGGIVRGDMCVETGMIRIGYRAGLVSTGTVTVQTLTASQSINANGGINIPLAAGAPTDTVALNRAYALGMAQLVLMHQARTYWLTSSCKATNGVTINHVVPGIYSEARLGSNGHTSLTMRTTGVIGGSNYNKILGYSLPIRNTGSGPGNWSKVSMRMGAGGEWTECPDAGMDDYRFRPVVGSAPSIARLVEVTLYYQDGYKARVRELIGIGNPRSYVVRTTTSAINHDSNTGLESSAYRLVIAQSNLSYNDELAAGVWLMIGGAVNNTVLKLADIRGWDTYHTSSAPVLYLDVQAGVYGGMAQMESPTILNGIGSNTYVRYGLEPYQRSWITSETEEPYTDPDQPTA